MYATCCKRHLRTDAVCIVCTTVYTLLCFACLRERGRRNTAYAFLRAFDCSMYSNGHAHNEHTMPVTMLVFNSYIDMRPVLLLLLLWSILKRIWMLASKYSIWFLFKSSFTTIRLKIFALYLRLSVIRYEKWMLSINYLHLSDDR